MSRRYRVDCLNPACRWVGYRINAYECECYDYVCRAEAPGSGCPNGANLFANCPHCKSDWEPDHRDLFASYLAVRKVWSRQEIRQFHAGRAKLQRERKDQ
ncbi:hypothetical protein [Streptomyces sp. NPDC046925]|uniref:hypothetical protein n=1 Tax=Streptomyces sp. NPDC046925 TaxID=3155375 RepID=UPI0033F4DF21